MKATIKYIPELTDVSETLLVPLFFKAKETLENGAIKDNAAVNIINNIEYDFNNMRTDVETQKLITIRTSILDSIVENYISKTENPVILNLGAGLDTRHLRFEKAKWYQLDLAEPIELRKQFFDDEFIINKSLLDFSWIDEIKEKENILIIIEGVLMYLEEHLVQSIFKELGFNFQNSYVAFDTIPQFLTKLTHHKSINLKQAPFKWGNESTLEIESWGYGIKSIKSSLYLNHEIAKNISFSLLSNATTSANGLKVSLMKIN